MTKDRLENEYFEWMYNKVCWWRNNTSFKKLLQFLHTQVFYYVNPLDENRYMDGISLRYWFAEDMDYEHAMVASLLDDRECSVLEMMVALSNRCEKEIMMDFKDDRTGYWFWVMLSSLGLTKMDDLHFDKRKVTDILHSFLERDYAFNGKGGLFTLQAPRRDLRDVEIWCQLMWYLRENVNEEDQYE